MATETMTLEAFNDLAKTLPENVSRKRLASVLGFELPTETVEKQLEKVAVVKHTPKANKKNPTQTERTYITIPGLDLGDGQSTRGVWVSAEVARRVFEKGLEVCDKEGL